MWSGPKWSRVEWLEASASRHIAIDRYRHRHFAYWLILAHIRSHWLLAGWLGGSGLAGSAGWLKYPLWPPKSNYYIGFSWFFLKSLQKPYVFIRFRKLRNAGFHNIAPLSVRLQFWLLNVNFTRRFWGWHSKSMVIFSRAPAKDPPEPRHTPPILFHM